MRRYDVPGGWYCDALPRQQYYAALVKGKHIETSLENVNLPNGQDALFIRIASVGRFACCGSQDDKAWEYATQGGWEPRGSIYGIQAVIFDANGKLLTVPDASHPAAPQGFRQVADNGQIIYVRDTYTQRYPYEWTTHGDLTIGQADQGPLGEDPCIAKMPDGSFRLIEPGRCRMIRFHRDGEHIVVAMVREDIKSSVIWWLTVSELDALPRFTRPTKDKPEEPKEPEEPEEPQEPEMPEESMTLPKNVYDTWVAVAEKYSVLHMSPDDNKRREATRYGWETIVARHPEVRPFLVLKTEHATGWSSQSKDTLGWVVDGQPIEHGREARMHMFDMINGTTRRTNPYPISSHNFEEGNEEAIILVSTPKDHLGGVVEPDPDPPVNSDLEERVKKLEQAIQVVQATCRDATLAASGAKSFAESVKEAADLKFQELEGKIGNGGQSVEKIAQEIEDKKLLRAKGTIAGWLRADLEVYKPE